MRTRNILLACGLAIILIGVTAAVTYSLAQSNDEQLEEYQGTDREYLSFDQIDQHIQTFHHFADAEAYHPLVPRDGAHHGAVRSA